MGRVGSVQNKSGYGWVFGLETNRNRPVFKTGQVPQPVTMIDRVWLTRAWFFFPFFLLGQTRPTVLEKRMGFGYGVSAGLGMGFQLQREKKRGVWALCSTRILFGSGWMGQIRAMLGLERRVRFSFAGSLAHNSLNKASHSHVVAQGLIFWLGRLTSQYYTTREHSPTRRPHV